MSHNRITVVKEFSFDSAHYLPEYDGPCRNMHGHTYKLQIGITGTLLEDDKVGMIMDFSILKKIVKEHIIDNLDHAVLNEVKYQHFPKNPTAENMVYWISRMFPAILHEAVKKNDICLTFIRLWETPTSYAEWRRD